MAYSFDNRNLTTEAISIPMATPKLNVKKRCRIPALLPNRRRRTGVYVDMIMSEHNPEDKKQLNLTAALRIIQNAGLPDPMLQSDNPDEQIQCIIDALCDLIYA